MADDLGMVARIYEKAGLELTSGARSELESFLAENPRGKYGQVRYDLRGDFGIDPAALRRRFDFYFERFAVRVED
jgi:hypothetical protein